MSEADVTMTTTEGSYHPVAPYRWEAIDPMSVYIQQDARGIKKVVEIAEDGRLIKHERPEVEA